MAKVLFTSDLHLGHKNIGKWRHFARDKHENTAVIAEKWFSSVNKRDTVFVLGDAVFTEEALLEFKHFPGRKILVRGNHDYLSTKDYLTVFEEVHGITRYRTKHGVNAWLTHAPIHPEELRGKINIHGHVHYNPIKDKRYINVCCDYLLQETGDIFMTLSQLREKLNGEVVT